MNAAALKRKKEGGSPAKVPTSRRRIQTTSDEHIVRPSISEHYEARCDNAYQAYILSMAQKLALRKACDDIKANMDDQLCVLEERKLMTHEILNHKSKLQVCKALQRCSVASDCSDQVLSSLQDDFVLNQSQTLQGFDESVRNELTLLPGIGVVGLGECLDQVAQGAMSLEESILESEVCKDAVDTQDTLREVFASMCKIHTEYTSMEDLPHEASLMFPGINFSINKI